MSTPIVVEDIRPLLAPDSSLVWLIRIMLAGEKRANLRELITFSAASVQVAVVLSMLPLVLGGSIIEFHIWQIFSYVPCSSGWMDRAFSLPWSHPFSGLPPRSTLSDI